VKTYVKGCRAADLCLGDEFGRHWTTIDEELYLFDLIDKKVCFSSGLKFHEGRGRYGI